MSGCRSSVLERTYISLQRGLCCLSERPKPISGGIAGRCRLHEEQSEMDNFSKESSL